MLDNETPTPKDEESTVDTATRMAARRFFETAADHPKTTAGVLIGALALGGGVATLEQHSRDTAIQAHFEADQKKADDYTKKIEALADTVADPAYIEKAFTLDDALELGEKARTIAVEIPGFADAEDENTDTIHDTAAAIGVYHEGETFVVASTDQLVEGETRLIVQRAPEGYVNPEDVEPATDIPTPITH